VDDQYQFPDYLVLKEAWCNTSIIPAFRKEEDCKFQDIWAK
jgi:hypothetical protein